MTDHHLPGLERCWVSLFSRRRWKRIAADVEAYARELDYRAAKDDGLTKDLASIHRAVGAAREAVKARNIEGGWKCLQTAQRMELLAAENRDFIEATAAIMHKEAEKLSGWRKEAVKDLLKVGSGETPRPERVYQAALLRDGYYNNEAYKDGLRRSSALFHAALLIIALVTLFWMVYEDYVPAVISAVADPGKAVESAMLLKSLSMMFVVGLIGATVSAMTDVPKAQTSTRIPEAVLSFRVTLLRLLIGPVSAMIVYLAALSGLATKILQTGLVSGYAILILGFVAGFTERLVLRVVEGVAGRPPA